jgi:hypothetical protein
MTSTNDTTDPDDSHRPDDRPSLVHLDEAVLVYDPEHPSAWIESDESVALADCR